MSKNGSKGEAFTALYRKYRPGDFASVRGQEGVVKVLEAAIKQKKVAHAYLFAGSRGTGKTSMARIFAKALGVSEKDLYEMDAASQTGVDDIRLLQEGVATMPFDSPYKVYVIDEAHMLSKAAFNALLKTLEEPPRHVVFILATTEVYKLPETVVSRCQVFEFKKPSHETLKALVLDVAKDEGASLAPASAELIALMGEGSFRDTLGILQKVLTISSDKKLSEEEVAEVVGAPRGEVVNEFLQALAKNDIAGALSVAHKAIGAGVEAKTFLTLVLAKLRAVLLLRFAPDLTRVLTEQFSKEDFLVLEKLAGKDGATLNAALLSELITALLETPRAPIPLIPLELALYRVFGA